MLEFNDFNIFSNDSLCSIIEHFVLIASDQKFIMKYTYRLNNILTFSAR